MSRIVLDSGRQKAFLDKANKECDLDWSDIAHICGICERTLRDWRREKFYMKYEAAQALSKETSIPLRYPKEILPDHWNVQRIASIGAKRKYAIYGNPGTAEGRKKGGINSQRKFRENPDYAKRLGVKIRKPIRKPKNSSALAEFIGILLGDGGITDHQVTIAFNRETDKRHSVYTQKLLKRLFGIPSSIISRRFKNDKSDRIAVYSVNLVEFLLKKGLKAGNKIYAGIDIPPWIKNKNEYRLSCIRGLVDTDGSFYFYKHRVNGKTYNNFAICFTNYSAPLLSSVYKIFKEIGLQPSLTNQRLYLHRKKDIEIYIALIGSHNPKHISKYKIYKKERYGSG